MPPAPGGSGYATCAGINWSSQLRSGRATGAAAAAEREQLRLGPHTHVESVLVHVLLKDGKSLLVGARVEAVRLAAGLLGRVGARDDRLEELDEAVTFPLVGGQAARRCVCIDVSCVDCVAGAGGRCGAGRWKPGRSDTPRDERERLVLDWTIGTIDVNE